MRMKTSVPSWSVVLFLATTCAAAPPAVQLSGKERPDLVLRRLDGTAVRLEEFRGQVVLLDLWATWCEPCRHSLPFYGELYRAHQARGFTVLGVNLDENEDALRDFLHKVPVPFPVFRDPQAEGPRALGATAMPMAYLLDRTGVIRWRHAGFQRGDEPLLQNQVLSLLGEGRPLTSLERPVMGTLFRVSLRADDSPETRKALEACFEIFERVDRSMSEWKASSPLSEVNRRAGGPPVQVPDQLFALLQTARQVAEQSDGAFDPTWAALWGLWKFDGSNIVPGNEEIARRLPLVGWKDLELDPTARTARLRRPGMALGLGGIAKGYALGLAADELRRRGLHDFLLNAGGQILASGQKERGLWRTGIQDPRGEPGDYFCTLEVGDASVSTSGDYEHAFIKDGMRYHHLIDLRTGRPARSVRSATVIAADPTLADAYSTGAFVMGPQKALSFARERGFELLLVDDEGRVSMSDGLAARVKLLHPPRP